MHKTISLFIFFSMILGLQVTECDHYGIDLIADTAENNAGAATAIGTWTATPTNGQEWLDVNMARCAVMYN